MTLNMVVLRTRSQFEGGSEPTPDPPQRSLELTLAQSQEPSCPSLQRNTLPQRPTQSGDVFGTLEITSLLKTFFLHEAK